MRKGKLGKIFGTALACLMIGLMLGGLLGAALPLSVFGSQSQGLPSEAKTWHVDNDNHADSARIQDVINNVSAVPESLSEPINMGAIEEVYPLDESAREKVLQNGFVVLRNEEHDYISDCYMNLFSRPDVSVFITSDAILHIFHVVHDDMLKDIELQHLYNSIELLV